MAHAVLLKFIASNGTEMLIKYTSRPIKIMFWEKMLLIQVYSFQKKNFYIKINFTIVIYMITSPVGAKSRTEH